MSFQLKPILSKAYVTYRNTTLCLALFDTIEELLQENLLTPKQAIILIHQFEFSLRKKMKEATNEMSNYYFSARQIIAYRKIKNTYHLLLEGVQFYNKIPPQIIQHYLKTYKEYKSGRKEPRWQNTIKGTIVQFRSLFKTKQKELIRIFPLFSINCTLFICSKKKQIIGLTLHNSFIYDRNMM